MNEIPPELAAHLRTLVHDAVRAAVQNATGSTALFLSARSIARRWDCSRSAVYRAVSEMIRDGYLECVYVGSDRRVSLASIETFERLHTDDPRQPRGRRVPKSTRTPRGSSRVRAEPPADRAKLRALFRAAARGPAPATGQHVGETGGPVAAVPKPKRPERPRKRPRQKRDYLIVDHATEDTAAGIEAAEAWQTEVGSRTEK